jgi:hypothetical protein
MKNNVDVTIYLSDEDAVKFKQFMANYDKIKVLLDSGALNQKSASISLNFDHNGILQTVQRADLLYSKKFANF